jgi:type I restriction enzyme S subunit
LTDIKALCSRFAALIEVERDVLGSARETELRLLSAIEERSKNLIEAREQEDVWREGRLCDLADVVRSIVNPFDFPDREFSLYSIPAFDAHSTPERCLGKAILSGKQKVSGDCVLVSRLNPNTPRVWLVLGASADTSVCSTEFAVLKPKNREYLYYLYVVCCSDKLQGHLEARAVGSTGSRQRVHISDLMASPVLIPPEEVLRAVTELMAPIEERLALARKEAEILAGVRKALGAWLGHSASDGKSSDAE